VAVDMLAHKCDEKRASQRASRVYDDIAEAEAGHCECAGRLVKVALRALKYICQRKHDVGYEW
jgi:hypothetical protein